MKYRSAIRLNSTFVPENVGASLATRAAGIRDSRQSLVIVEGLSCGQGASREHVSICLAHPGGKIRISSELQGHGFDAGCEILQDGHRAVLAGGLLVLAAVKT